MATKTQPTENIAIVNNTNTDIRDYDGYFLAALRNGGNLPAELADLFSFTVLKGYNPDGSNRGIVDWA